MNQQDLLLIIGELVVTVRTIQAELERTQAALAEEVGKKTRRKRRPDAESA